MNLPDSATFMHRCSSDGEFMLAARHWNGGIRLLIGETLLGFSLEDGVPVPGDADSNVIQFSGSEAVWQKVTSAVPERFHNDLMANVSTGSGFALHDRSKSRRPSGGKLPLASGGRLSP